MARVAVIFTGGTISSRRDPVAGGNVPVLRGGEILAATPGLDEIAGVLPIDRGLTPASHFSFADILAISATVEDALADPDVAGAVVVQGTDTIDETAFAWDLLHAGPKPVVVTGAMKAASDAGYEGPTNLRDAVRIAADPDVAAADVGVVVVLGRTIEPGDDVTKTHSSAYDTFQSLSTGRLGRIEDDRVVLERPRGPRRRLERRPERAAERVHLVTAVVAMDGAPIDALLAAGADGFVVAATGAGDTSAALLAAAERAMAAGLPVVHTTRCPAGAASAAYAFPGGGATWVRAGAIPAGHLGGPKARVALALGLRAGLDQGGLVALLADPTSIADPDWFWRTHPTAVGAGASR
jgi:L-asparaginase